MFLELFLTAHMSMHTHTHIHQLETDACHRQFHSGFVTGPTLRGRATDASIHKHAAIRNAGTLAIKAGVTCAYLSARIPPGSTGDRRADGAPLECVM